MTRARRGDDRQDARTLAFLPGTQLAHADLLGRALDWAITDDVFDPVRTHGNTTWLPRALVVQAILWVWSSCHQLTEGFGEARQLSARVLGCAAVGSYQGL